MTIGEIIQRTRKKFPKEVVENPVKLSSAYLYSLLLSARNLVLEQKSKKKQFISKWNYQTVKGVKMIRINHRDCDLPYSSDCIYLASEKPIPKPLSNYNKHLISEVISSEDETVFTEVDSSSLKYASGNKYTKSRKSFYIKDRKLYLSSNIGPQYVDITGVFEDPLEACFFSESCGNCNKCESYLDQEFYADQALIPTIIEIALSELVGGGRGQAQQQNEQQETE